MAGNARRSCATEENPQPPLSIVLALLLAVPLPTVKELQSNLHRSFQSVFPTNFKVRANLEFIKKLGVGHAKYQGKSLVRFGPTDLVCFRTLQDHARKVKKTFLQCEIVGKQFPICHEHVNDTILEFGRRMLHISGSLIPAHTCNIHWLAKHGGDGTVTERSIFLKKRR